jgi:alpha-tubulin suppressor-like RCC1 family protein
LPELVGLSGRQALGAVSPSPEDGERTRPEHPGISRTPSSTEPYWSCPKSLCEAIADPAVDIAGRWVQPNAGRLLEGSGEKGGYSPQDLQSAYAIPPSGGSGQTIALVEAYGYESAEADLARYRERYGLEPCTRENRCFRKVNQFGEEAGYPGPEKGWEGESSLDLDMASAACPHCHILLVEAIGPGLQELGSAVDTAARLGATEISNSYGTPEEYCPADCEEYNGHYEHPGIVITASAGDDGYDDHYEGAQSPSFPATSPSVVAVGGTSLSKAAGTRGWSEEAWNEPSRGIGTGSGCSRSQQKPVWQADTGCADRMDNDVAAVAACLTPVSVYSTPYGGWEDFCGTSASSPLVAGIAAHASEYVRSLPGADAFYADPGAFFDVTKGSDGTCTAPAESEYLCHAQAGYDGPTGLGTPDGALTIASAAPAVNTYAATSATSTGATLNGAVDPNELETVYRFEYGTSTAYGTSVPVPSASVGAGTSAVSVTQSLTALHASTTYHYRLAATNSAGTSYGADRSFRAAAPSVTGLSTSAGPAAGGTPVTITGTSFVSVSAVKFGGVNAHFTVESETSISAVSPAGHGTVDVTVSTPAGTSATTSADRFAYALGPVLAFGYNPYGDLGNDTTEGSHVPVEVLDLPPAKELAGGLALLEGGTVMAWGENGYGQLGPSNSSGPEKCEAVEPCSLKPVAVSGLSEEVTAIAAGSGDDFALLKDGTVMAWGDNYEGQLGNASAGNESATPVPVCTADESPCKPESYLREVTAIAAGSYHTLALLKNGTVMAWGENSYGQLGVGSSTGPQTCDGYYACSTKAVKITSLSEVTAIAAAGEDSLALLRNGTVMSWGENESGQLGDGTSTGPELCKPRGYEYSTACAKTPVMVEKLSREVSTVAAGSDFGVALLKNGTAFAWGHNYEGELGDGTTSGPETCVPEDRSARPCSDIPVAVIGLSEVSTIAANGQHTLALLKSGRVKVWGGNYTGELGIGTAVENSDLPVEPCAALEAVPCAKRLEGIAVVGAGFNQGYVSAGPSFAAPPTVTQVSPSHGTSAGGTTVTITGTHFTGATAVRFGTVGAEHFTATSETSITAISPAGAGTVDVTVQTPAGTSATSPADHFTYVPPVERAEYTGWILTGSITSKKAGQAIVLPAGSRFNGSGEVNVETGAGSVAGNISIPAFTTSLNLFGLLPTGVGVTLSQVGALAGTVTTSNTTPGEETLTLPLKLKLGFTSVKLLGLTIPTKCATWEPVSLSLTDTLTREELLEKGWSFAGTTTLPAINCEGGLLGSSFGPILSSLLSGPANPYSLSIKAP